MVFYDVLTNENIVQEIDDICDSDSSAYPFERKAARLNAALDSYFQLAWSVNRSRPVDDTNQSAISLEEQNVVSGTNSFKMGDFTNKMVGIIELTILDEDGVPTKLIPENFSNLTDNFEELYGSYGTSLTTGTPEYYTIVGDFIYVRPTPDYSKTSGLQIYGNRVSSKFTYTRCTITNASPGVLTTSSVHGLVANDTIILRTTGTLPTGLSVDTLYYVKEALTTKTLTLTATQGGTVINTSSAGSGEHAFLESSKVPGIPPIYDHYMYLARKASLPYLSDRGKNNIKDIVALLGQDEARIIEYFANKDTDTDNKITFKQRAYK